MTTLLGSLFLGISLTPNPILLIVVPLCAIPLSGIGALIAANARTPQDSGAISLLVTVVLVSLGPVVIPANRLPQILLFLGRLSPATYAASALRQALLGPVTPQIFLDLFVLTLFSVGIFWLVSLKLNRALT